MCDVYHYLVHIPYKTIRLVRLIKYFSFPYFWSGWMHRQGHTAFSIISYIASAFVMVSPWYVGITLAFYVLY
jgi:hypothetical protein